jgi:hypothetical protein
MKENIKKAMDLAEQEVQEKEIAQLKSIIKDLLQKKVNKEEEKREIEKEISIIKQTIDDFKAGRLDKVKELIEKDIVAKDLLPFKIIIINQPVYVKPWNWTYKIEQVPNYTYTSATAIGNNSLIYYSGNNLMTTTLTNCTTGNDIATFTAGTYSLDNDRIINL